jgi:iron complex outermembrane receptor protein
VSSGTLRGEGHFENVERTRRTGLEAGVEYAVADRLAVFGAYTLQRATFGSDLRIASRFHPLAEGTDIFVASGDRLPGVPAQSAKFGIETVVAGGLRAGVNGRVQSGQYLRGDESNLLPVIPGFVVVDFVARQRITSRITLVGQVANIFDRRYSTFGVLGDAELLGEAFADPRFYSPGAPRGGWIGVEVRF